MFTESKIAVFEKVTFEEFLKAFGNLYGFESDQITDEAKLMLEDIWKKIELPTRSTVGSAGYDFKCPFGFHLKPGDNIVIPTGIKVKISGDWFLGLYPRSGMGSKYRFMLANTVGIIDSDYYNNPGNEGHIMAKISYDTIKLSTKLALYRDKEGKACTESFNEVILNPTYSVYEFKQGDKFLQGILQPFGKTINDVSNDSRFGGMGSTGA